MTFMFTHNGTNMVTRYVNSQQHIMKVHIITLVSPKAIVEPQLLCTYLPKLTFKVCVVWDNTKKIT